MIQQPEFEYKFDFNGRDFACLMFALALHSLLLLWKGGMLHLPDENGGGLGDTLINVEFRNDLPSYEPAGGGSAPKAEGIFAKMKSMLKGQGAAGEKNTEIAKGNAVTPIETPKQAWAKTDTLTNKPFADTKGFQGVAKKDALDIAMGKTQEVLVKPSQGNFKQADPNLKENKFKIATRDVPFKIVTTNSKEELANVNAIPVNVGQTTSANVKSLSGGAGAGPALQSKSFASKGSTASGGFGGSAGSSKSGGQLAMGGSAGSGPAGGSGLAGGGMSGGGGGASGYGTGRGTGTGTGSGNGSGSGSGRAWSGGGGGTGFGNGGGGMSTLQRNTVTEGVSSGNKSIKNTGFTITGALANRPIVQKAHTKYEIDCRVALRFRVDWSGKVLDGILVEVSSGSPTFDQKVIASLQQWLFSQLPASRTNEVQEGVITFVFKGV